MRLFWLFTFLGNGCVGGGAILFHYFEYGNNPSMSHYLDSLTWAVGIVTTVGSGNIAPVTIEGKVLQIFMMMFGAVFLWSYMAMFIGILVEPDLALLEKEVSEIQHEVKDLSGAR